MGAIQRLNPTRHVETPHLDEAFDDVDYVRSNGRRNSPYGIPDHRMSIPSHA